MTGPSAPIRLTKALCVTLLMTIGGFAMAESRSAGDSSSSPAIEEIIVTATYRETSLMDTPISISAVDADTIEQLGATDLSGLFRTMPGLNMTADTAGGNRMVIRGISAQSGALATSQTSATIATYIDDTPMTSANGPARQLGGSLFDIERVEVLKGPQGTLFGEGSQGGTIRYLYNAPDPEAVDYKIKAGFNSQHESDDNGFRVDGMVNVPLADNFAVRVSAFTEEKAGWIDKVSATFPANDVNTSKSAGGRVSAKWWPTDQLSVQASVFYVDTETEGDTVAQVAYQELVNASIPGMPARSEDEVTLYNLRFDYDFSWATLTSTTSFFERQTNSLAENPFSFAVLFDQFAGFAFNLDAFFTGGAPLIPCNPGPQDAFLSNFATCPWGDGMSIIALNSDSTSESDRFVQEARLVSSGEGPWLWTVGVFYKTSQDDRYDFQPFALAPGREALRLLFAPLFENNPANTHDNTVDELSVFGEATYLIGEDWEITAGVRVSDLKQEFKITGIKTDDTPVSPKIVLAWHPNDDQLYYFSYATGFRPGNVNSGQFFNVQQFTAGGLPQEIIDQARSRMTFDSDEVANYELGTKFVLADGRVQVTAAAYYLDWKDMITLFTDFNIPGTNNSFNENAGAAHSQGVELDIVWTPLERLNLRLAGDINKAETDEDNIGGGIGGADVPKGNRLIYSPEWSLSASIDYSFDLAGSLAGRLRLDHQRVDKQYADVANTSLNLIDGYHLTNLRFTLTDRSDARWSASLFANNLTNEAVVLNAGFTGSSVNLYYSQPRLIGLEATWQMR